MKSFTVSSQDDLKICKEYVEHADYFLFKLETLFDKSLFSEYKEDVERVIQDISKRLVNKRVGFEETTLLIPENTRINLKHGNIVDEKTGYGIAIMFKVKEYCTEVFYRKKVKDNKYILLYYNNMDKDLNEIAQKIIKANGLTNTCK